MTRRRRTWAVVLVATAIGGAVGVAGNSPSGQAHTCVLVTTVSPPSTVLLPPGAGPCDPEHHPDCQDVSPDGVTVAVCPGVASRQGQSSATSS